eukprot:4283257-Amphidinium_carterae.2
MDASTARKLLARELKHCRGRHGHTPGACPPARNASDCPMAGRRAPEMAVGAYKGLLQNIANSNIKDVLAVRAALLTQEQVTLLLSDFEAAVERLEATIVVKTAGWSTPPLALATYRTLPQVAAQQEHPLTRKFLQDKCDALEEWSRSDGEPRDAELELMIAKVALWPITERWMEAEHSELKRLGSYKNVGPAFCSLSVRYATCMASITSCADDFRELCEQFEHLRSPRQIMKFFMLQGHPAVSEALLNHRLARTSSQSRNEVARLRKAVASALYLTHGQSQWEQSRDNIMDIESLRAQAPGAWAGQLPQPVRHPSRGLYDKMLELLFRQHVSQLQHDWFSLHQAGILHAVEELLVAPLVDTESESFLTYFFTKAAHLS